MVYIPPPEKLEGKLPGFRCTTDMQERIRIIAEQSNTSVGAVMRHAVGVFLNQNDDELDDSDL